MKNILILGIGNILQSDEGLGSHYIEYLENSDIQFPENVELADGGTTGYALMQVMQNRDKIIIIDALKADGEPGAVYRFSTDNAVKRDPVFSLHEVGIMNVIDTLKISGSNPEIEFIGVIPEDISTFNISLSQPVKDSFPEITKQVLDIIKKGGKVCL